MAFDDHPQFSIFLSNTRGAPSVRERFVASSFLQEERVSKARAASYDSVGAANRHASFLEWTRKHEQYLASRVFSGEPPLHKAPLDSETFHDIGPEGRGAIPRGTRLIHLKDLDFFALFSSFSLEEIEEAFTHAAAAEDPTSSHADLANIILREAWGRCETRPVFAAPWRDVQEILSEDDWADCIRDRLGLFHINPDAKGAGRKVVLFRYEVRVVRKLSGQRALVAPSVLDGRLNPAFYPSRTGDPTGYAVDLAAERVDACAEMVHPPVAWTGAHIYRVGSVRRRVADTQLTLAREWHEYVLEEGGVVA